jgi:hypothetical protein
MAGAGWAEKFADACTIATRSNANAVSIFLEDHTVTP